METHKSTSANVNATESSNDEPQVLATGNTNSPAKSSRREFLALAAATVAAATLPGCSATPTPTLVPAPTATPQPPELPKVEAAKNQLDLLSGPGPSYNVVIKGLAAGTPLYVVEKDKSESWYKVRTEEKKEGWVRATDVKPVFAGFITTREEWDTKMKSVPISVDMAPVPTVRTEEHTTYYQAPTYYTSHYWRPN